MTALHWAVKRGNTEIVEILLKQNADPDARDLVGRTPLYFAIMSNLIEVVKVFFLIIVYLNKKLLLYYRANPWSTEKLNYEEIC